MSGLLSPATSAALGRFLAARNLTGEAIRVRPIGDGHSNLTYLVDDGERTVVVRRPPPPPLPPGANDVLREAAIVKAVGRGAVPVPEILATGATGDVFDVPFFVMSAVEGPVVTTRMPDLFATPAARAAVADSLVDALVALHAFDWRAAGLRGSPAGSNLRHRSRLARLVEHDGGAPAAFADVDAWLVERAPAESGAALLHNDFRLGNVVLDPAVPKVAAVLDWELAAVGDPLVDLGYLLATWAPADGAPLTPVQNLGAATAEPGFGGRDALAARYAAATGRDVSGLGWYEALAQWKLAVLYEYNRRKAVAGAGDQYYADPRFVASFLEAARRAAGIG